MRGALLFVVIVLGSGASAGLVHGAVNFAVVEPYLDRAILDENQRLFASGDAEDTPEFWAEYEGYRAWQKGGQILSGVVLGTSVGALFGAVFALSRGALPGGDDLRRSLVLAGIMWLTIYAIPFLKYPPNLPGSGSGDTVVERVVLYLAFMAISGFGAVAFHRVSRALRGRAKLASLAGYGALVCAAFLAMPDSPDTEPLASEDPLVNGFRAMSVVGVTAFWASAGIMLGLLWRRIGPYRQAARQPYG